VNHARLPETGIVDGGALVVRNHGAVASLGDAQTVDGGTGRFGDGIVQLLAIGVRADRNGLGELLDGFTWVVVSVESSEFGQKSCECIPRGSTISVISDAIVMMASSSCVVSQIGAREQVEFTQEPRENVGPRLTPRDVDNGRWG